VGVAMLVCMTLGVRAAEPHRVLLLHSFGRDFAPFSDFAGHFREQLARQSPAPIDLYEASLESARFREAQEEAPFAEYLRALFAGRKLDLVVAIGAPATHMLQRHRARLFPSTPALIAVEQRFLNEAVLGPNDAAAAFSIHDPALIEHILRLRPETTSIAVVIGTSPLEKFWGAEMQREFQRFSDRINFIWFNELSLDEMLKRAAALPPRSAIYYTMVAVDAKGVPHAQDRVLDAIHAVASAPIFGFADGAFGKGIVGGPLISMRELGRRAAAASVRILGGEEPGEIRPPPLGLAAPVYDWRELQRWNISEALLPPDSTVQFREPGLWELHRRELTAIVVAVLAQAGIIVWLLFERARRRRAEAQSHNRLLEVMHLNRAAAAGALSASIAHELNQPLGAILTNAEAAELLLAADRPDLDQVKEILGDIRQADQRAADIIQHLRALLRRKSEMGAQQLDLRDAIASAMQILSPEATRRGIVLSANGSERPLPVRADIVHLQQVILNLASNAMDAMNDAAPGSRRMTIETALTKESEVEVSVTDSGTGIPGVALDHVFDTFYTTKPQGTGLGLSITRTIVDTYGGRIRAENLRGGGAVFRFTLPLAEQHPA
jgi:signal transduction histidine kinase